MVCHIVSILIVMDVLLEVLMARSKHLRDSVSILIVMDVLLEAMVATIGVLYFRFNPYCNGCTSRSM